VVVGVLVAVAAAVVVVRELALALGAEWAWPLTEWWRSLVEQPSWTTTGAVALVFAAAGAALMALAVWPSPAVSPRPEGIALDGERGVTTLSLTAVNRTVEHSLAAAGVNLVVSRLSFSEDRGGLRLLVEADVPAVNLAGVQAAAFDAIAPELERLCGLRPAAVDLVVQRLLRAGEGEDRS
jgi:hypothetical protein